MVCVVLFTRVSAYYFAGPAFCVNFPDLFLLLVSRTHVKMVKMYSEYSDVINEVTNEPLLAHISN